MKYITLTLFVSLCVSLPISACGFHDNFDNYNGAYGSNWTLITYDDANDEMLQSTETVDDNKPVFSSAATRASDLAKARLNAEKLASKKDTDEESSEDKASDTETVTDQKASLTN